MMFLQKTTFPSIDAGGQGDGGTAVSVISILGSRIFPTNILGLGLGLGMHFARPKECTPSGSDIPGYDRPTG